MTALTASPDKFIKVVGFIRMFSPSLVIKHFSFLSSLKETLLSNAHLSRTINPAL